MLINESDETLDVRTRGWRRLTALHSFIESALEKELQDKHGLSVVEYTVLDTLNRQRTGWHMRMQQLAQVAALSNSAATRLVTRLEERKLLKRVLCMDDRRGIYAELTQAGRVLLEVARPTNDRILSAQLDQAESMPGFGDLARTVSEHGPNRDKFM